MITHYRTTAPKNVTAGNINNLSVDGSLPPFISDRFAYGVITDVNDLQQVRVRLYDRKGSDGSSKLILNGKFIPLATQLTTIQLLYGTLRKGLQVLVHWRGRLEPTWAIAHIIGDEELDILEEEQLPTGVVGPPIAFLSGGLTDL